MGPAQGHQGPRDAVGPRPPTPALQPTLTLWFQGVFALFIPEEIILWCNSNNTTLAKSTDLHLECSVLPRLLSLLFRSLSVCANLPGHSAHSPRPPAAPWRPPAPPTPPPSPGWGVQESVNCSFRIPYLVERPARDCCEPKLAEGVGDVHDLKETHSSSGPAYFRFLTVLQVAVEFSDSEVKTSSGWRRLGAASATSSCQQQGICLLLRAKLVPLVCKALASASTCTHLERGHGLLVA